MEGRGVRATKTHKQEDYLLEFSGELLTGEEADAREIEYTHDKKAGNHMFFIHTREKVIAKIWSLTMEGMQDWSTTRRRQQIVYQRPYFGKIPLA